MMLMPGNFFLRVAKQDCQNNVSHLLFFCGERRTFLEAQCPLLANSGLFGTPEIMSAFGGKADAKLARPDVWLLAKSGH